MRVIQRRESSMDYEKKLRNTLKKIIEEAPYVHVRHVLEDGVEKVIITATLSAKHPEIKNGKPSSPPS